VCVPCDWTAVSGTQKREKEALCCSIRVYDAGFMDYGYAAG